MRTSCNIPIGGFHKQSLIDYPGHISSVVFTRGCNFRCNYCHNYQLIDPVFIDDFPAFSGNDIFNWIDKNKLLLDAVVVTGGEPTLHTDLPDFIREIKSFGLKIKLDTNGTNPEMLQSLLNETLLDYIAMDIKAPLVLEKYQKVVGEEFSEIQLRKVKLSVQMLNETLVNCEFRTTFDESLCLEDLASIVGSIKCKYFIQNMLRDGRKVGERFEEKDAQQLLRHRLSEYEIKVRN